jgi:hypothetical protein
VLGVLAGSAARELNDWSYFISPERRELKSLRINSIA